MDKAQEELVREMKTFFMKGLSAEGGSFLVASIADLLAAGLDSDEIDTFSNFLQAIGQTMSYISAQRTLNDNKKIQFQVEDKKFFLKGSSR